VHNIETCVLHTKISSFFAVLKGEARSDDDNEGTKHPACAVFHSSYMIRGVRCENAGSSVQEGNNSRSCLSRPVSQTKRLYNLGKEQSSIHRTSDEIV
jgi:hypothetical protein